MTTDLFTTTRERKEAKLGLCPQAKDAERQAIQRKTEAFLAAGGVIQVFDRYETRYDKNLGKTKLSEREIDKQLKLLAAGKRVTLQ